VRRSAHSYRLAHQKEFLWIILWHELELKYA